MQNMVFLDFDGVLFNTVKEAYAVATIAHGKYSNIDDISYTTEYYKNFLKLRYLVGPAWNYKYILEFLDKISDLDKIKEEYKFLIKHVNKDDYAKFEDLFFETRKILKKKDFQKWLQLNEPFEFLDFIRPLLVAKDESFVIITTKDKSTVCDLLRLNSIDFNCDAVYDRKDFEQYKSKANIISYLQNIKKIDLSIFIDDSKEHLNSCASIKKLELLQAGWGYISKDDNGGMSEDLIFEKIKKLIG